MDAPRMPRQGKNPKPNESQEIYDGGSRLCDLPDAILIHILSYLSLKEAVRTSILSRRWEYLWTYNPELIFCDNCQFVERALILRYHQAPIKVFSLKGFDVERNASRINTWIGAAIRCTVEHLKLSLVRVSKSYVLPNCIFSCQTLVEFHLKANYDYILRVPSSIQLPSLKVLKLSDMILIDTESVEKLFSCPSLERLLICSCGWINSRSVRISAPKLRELRLDTNAEDDDDDGFQVSIDGASLRYFTYDGQLTMKYCIVGASELVEADISTKFAVEVEEEADMVSGNGYHLLSSLFNVKTLALRYSFLEILGYKANLQHLVTLPEFSNMTKMTVEIKLIRREWIALMGILRKSPFLRSLTVHMKFGEYHLLEEEPLYELPGGYKYSFYEPDADPVPSCFLTQLKRIRLFPSYNDLDEMIHAAGVLLKRAMVLDKVVLGLPEEMLLDEDCVYMQKINQLPSKCALDIYAIPSWE